MQNLDKRLSKAASFVKAGSRVCDVGCDHGYLSAFLYSRGDIESVCATDINEKPLKNAQNTFDKYGITDIKLICCDGLEKITRDMADTVIIAGMGGDVISGIIDRAAFLRDNTVSLILQPMTSADALRVYLAKEGFNVEKEEAVFSSGRVYSVMLARFDGKARTLDGIQKRIGKVTAETQEGKVYIKRQIDLCRQYLENISRATGMQQQAAAANDTIKKLKELLGEE